MFVCIHTIHVSLVMWLMFLCFFATFIGVFCRCVSIDECFFFFECTPNDITKKLALCMDIHIKIKQLFIIAVVVVAI